MNKISIATIIILSACTTVEQTSTASQDVSWTCTTIAHCTDDAPQTTEHTFCAAPSANDVLEPGDAAASDFATGWIAACNAEQGQISDTPHLCLSEIYECRVFECHQNYVACTP